MKTQESEKLPQTAWEKFQLLPVELIRRIPTERLMRIDWDQPDLPEDIKEAAEQMHERQTRMLPVVKKD